MRAACRHQLETIAAEVLIVSRIWLLLVHCVEGLLTVLGPEQAAPLGVIGARLARRVQAGGSTFPGQFPSSGGAISEEFCGLMSSSLPIIKTICGVFYRSIFPVVDAFPVRLNSSTAW